MDEVTQTLGQGLRVTSTLHSGLQVIHTDDQVYHLFGAWRGHSAQSDQNPMKLIGKPVRTLYQCTWLATTSSGLG